MMLWHPIVEWTSSDAFATHAACGIPLHEACTRYGSSRLSCRYCVLQSLADAKASASAPSNRDALLHLAGLEAGSTFSFQPARWLADTAPDLLTPDLRALIAKAKAKAAAALRRRLEAELPAGLRYVNGWPPRLPTWGEAAAIADARAQMLRRYTLADLHPDARSVRERFAELLCERKAA